MMLFDVPLSIISVKGGEFTLLLASFYLLRRQFRRSTVDLRLQEEQMIPLVRWKPAQSQSDLSIFTPEAGYPARGLPSPADARPGLG